MELQEFVGLDYLKTPHDEFYGAVVDKIGLKILMLYLPFDMKTLRAAYQEDKAFNSRLTPLERWDNATGMRVVSTYNVQSTGTGLRYLMATHGVTVISMSELVCILKQAAKRAVLAEETNA